MIKFFKNWLAPLLLPALLFSCKSKPGDTAEKEPDAADIKTPVTVTSISTQPMTDTIVLNATSAFLQKSYVKAITNGYLSSLDVRIGSYVKAGQALFTVQTKEAKSIGNSINLLDSTFKFSGVTTIRANANGYLTQLDHQGGDYVQDGEQVGVISDLNSFVFLLDLPYELRPYVIAKSTVTLLLPDGEKLNGTVAATMPVMNAASQTQSVVIKVNATHNIPENLVARVNILKANKANAVSLPRSAVLTDETQTEFWVMKMIDSSTAVKTPVKKGLETSDRIEILSPVFSATDKIIVTGNYGLADTAGVKIVSNEK